MKSDRVFSVICMGISFWLIQEALNYSLIKGYTPGPAFMPFWTGVILFIFAIALLIETFKKTDLEKGKKDGRLPPTRSLFRIGLIVLITAGAVVAMDFFGFTLATILFVTIILFFLEGFGPIKSILTGLAFGFSLFIVFIYWMEVNLPKGFLGF